MMGERKFLPKILEVKSKVLFFLKNRKTSYSFLGKITDFYFLLSYYIPNHFLKIIKVSYYFTKIVFKGKCGGIKKNLNC